MSTISPESIGPNTKIRAQLYNFLSQQKSKTHFVRNHLRTLSNETEISVGRHNISQWSSKEDVNFIDYIAHITQSSIQVKKDKGQILYEKQRFHDLRVRGLIFKGMISTQKELQVISSKIADASTKVNNLTNALEVKMKKKDCLEIILGELIFQMDRFNTRLGEADKINAAVSQAQALAAKKAKMTRMSGIKGSVFITSGQVANPSTILLNKTRSSRSSGLNRGSQYLDNSRNLSRHAINIASKMNLSIQ